VRKALATVVVAATLASCGGDQVEDGTANREAPKVESTPRQPAVPAEEQSLRADLEDNFGGGLGGEETSWYQFIEAVTIQPGFGDRFVRVETSLFNDADATKPAQAICSGTLGLAQMLGGPIFRVEVRGRNGETIKECQPS